jgi:hypothetical protein
MALSFLKKPAAVTAKPPGAGSNTQHGSGISGKLPGSTSSQPAASSGKAAQNPANAGKISAWMKKGANAKTAVAQAEAKVEAAKAEAGKLWRFWMPADSERMVTFLDGGIDDEGMLDIPVWNEHRVKVNGDWESFVCVAEEEPCPGCESGDHRAGLVGALTILDHTPYTIKSGPNAGKTKQDSRKLFVPTRQTMKILTSLAKKLPGGLAGRSFTVMRTGDKEPGVGNQFMWDNGPARSPQELAALYSLKAEECMPADYSHEITHRTAEELGELGWVKPLHGVGNEKGVVDKAALKKQL